MSEQGEHTSEGTEAETIPTNRSNEQLESEASMINNQTAQPMLEDEEMPTYISVSSPSRREDSSVNNTKHESVPVEEDHSRSPYPSDDQGGGSVYVLSSGEESDHPPFNDEEEDEYGDTDDMDDMDLENEHGNAMMEDEEEEEDDEDEDEESPLRMHNDDDDEIDGEYELQCSDRASDDFILSNRLKKYHKERSLSLQDLSICKSNVRIPYNKKRHSINIVRQNYLSCQQNAVMYPVTHRKQSMPLRYGHIESKVRRYIKDIKEQNRRSMERRIKDQEYMITKNHTKSKNNDIEQQKPAITSKTLKNYAEKAIKDLQREEDEQDANAVRNTAQVLENGESNKGDLKPTDDQNKRIQIDSETEPFCETVWNDKNMQSCDKKEKRNGSVNVNSHQASINRNSKFSEANDSGLVNGHQAAPTLFNLQTLMYGMHAAPTTTQKENSVKQTNIIQEEENEKKRYNNSEIINVLETENNTTCPIRIENVTSIKPEATESINEVEHTNVTKANQTDKTQAENLEISNLKAQLNQKTAQFNSLHDAYQKTLAENLRMKQELDTLRKSLLKYENDNKPCETKTASVQAETISEPVSNQDGKETNNKVSTSSVASTISSIDQWADSACSPAISIKPPDLTTILNSDDSIVLTDGTPRKTARPLSRAFITSSRILQTLSNITQGKTRPESPLVRNSKKRINENPPDQLLNLDCTSPIQASSSKKRKATDMLGTSTFAQPFKIPHTATDSQKKYLSPTAHGEFKYPAEASKFNSEQMQNSRTNVNTSQSENFTATENKVEETVEDSESNVKCFVYREDENSKDQSFLIQAEEPTKDGLVNEKGRVRECGPYLLGNVEVRMSEVNGTISIWGKEVSQESITETEDETEMAETKTCPCWQKTPQTRFNGSPLVCSTNKKPKAPPRFCGSHCAHSPIKIPFTGDTVCEKGYINSPFSPNTNTHTCENCDSFKYRKEWATCKRTSNSQEKIHSCCVRHVEVKERECSCALYQEKQRYENSLDPTKDKLGIKGNRRSSSRNIPDSKYLNGNVTNTNIDVNEFSCKHNITCRCSPLPSTTESCQHASRCYNTVTNTSHTCRPYSANTSNHESMDKHCYSHSPSRDGDEEHLIPLRGSNETPETRQRRLSGKRVRAILMDLLKGCGDCRNSSVVGDNKNSSQEKKTSYLANNSPQIKISPALEPSCSNFTQSANRCCHAYARRIESQLEEFRIEMERVRSRSDAILDMLSMLHSVDMN